ncbi:MAG: hypothetical protein AB1486_33490 [Planctomycetota bacterium]
MKTIAALAVLGAVAASAMAQDVPPQYLNVTNTDGSLESGWLPGWWGGDSAYWNSRFDGLSGRMLAGVAVGSADFGSGTPYPRLGLHDANWTVDPTGNTPDLGSGFTAGPVDGGGAVFNYVFGSFGGNVVQLLEPQHVVCQSPPGNSGLLSIGNDDDTTTLFSGWTLDGYTRPANGGYNFGLNAAVDAIADLKALPGGCHSYLHEYLNGTDETGDLQTMTREAHEFYGILYHTSCQGAVWQMWLSSLGVPVAKLTPNLPTLPSGGGGYLRAGGPFPYGFGGQTFSFVAVGGVPAVMGSVHISNEITLHTKPDLDWGTMDDGTYEAGYSISFPAGSADYFNNNFNTGALPTTVKDFRLAVQDFGTTFRAFPTSGVFAANYGLDPTGYTPDLAVGYAVAPFTFLPGVLATTSAQMTINDFADFPYATFPTNDVHGVIQFPPGESGLLSVGTDTNSTRVSGSCWTLDGYTTPAGRFGDRFGIRLSAD